VARAEDELNTTIGFQRDQLRQGITRGQKPLPFYHRPELTRPNDFHAQVCQTLLNFAEGGLFGPAASLVLK